MLKRQTRIHFVLLLAFVGIIATAIQPASAAQLSTTPSLTGEQLVGTTRWDADCNADGTGRITIVGTGSASGPYKGTFRESGVVWVTKSGTTLYENFHATFEIRSSAPAARITGRKLEKPPQTFDGLNCQGYPLFGYVSDPPNGYQAVIRRGERTFQDQGTSVSFVFFNCTVVPPCVTDGMTEDFTSGKGATLVGEDSSE